MNLIDKIPLFRNYRTAASRKQGRRITEATSAPALPSH